MNAPGQAAPPRVRFVAADELTCYYDRPAEPSNVHIEARVAGSLDQSALRAAVSAVLAGEPGLRARRAATRGWRREYFWEFPAEADADPVRVASYADLSVLARLRSDLLSQSPPLRTSPPLLVLLATGPSADTLILNAHHARFDGLSALRLLRQVAQAYSGLAGGMPGRPGGPGGDGPEPARPRVPGPGLVTRIAGHREPGAAGRLPGYGTCQVAWDGLAAAGAWRSAGCSVNDLLIAAMMIAISEWNQDHGARSGLIRITMPVGDPAQATAAGQWANLSRLTTVTARVAPGAGVAGLLAEVAGQTRYAKRHTGGQVDPLSLALTRMPAPVAVKRTLLRTAMRVLGHLACDTCLISNLGVIAPVRFGQAGEADVWFSTSAHMPRGLSLGAVTTGGRLRLTFRYRRALFSDDAASDFAGRYVGILAAVAGRGVPA